MNIEITNDFRVLIDGADAGTVADVIVNHLASVDPENPADSIPYRVATALTDRYCEECDALRAEAAAAKNPPELSEEDEAQALAERILRQQRIEARALEIVKQAQGE